MSWSKAAFCLCLESLPFVLLWIVIASRHKRGATRRHGYFLKAQRRRATPTQKSTHPPLLGPWRS